MKTLIALSVMIVPLAGMGQVKEIKNPDRNLLTRIEAKKGTSYSREFPEEYGVRVMNQDTVVYVRSPFQCQSATFKRSTLISPGVNYFDNRIMGTWISFNRRFIYRFRQDESGNVYYQYYMFNKKTGAYDMQCLKSLLSVTQIDDKYFIERNSLATCDEGLKKVTEEFIRENSGSLPINYRFTDDDHLSLRSISLKYALQDPEGAFSYDGLRQFKSPKDYRDYISTNGNKDDFFGDDYTFTRFKENFKKTELMPNRDTNGSELAALLLIAVLLTDGSGSSNHNATQKDSRTVIGYDKWYNPVYDSGGSTGGGVYYDANGHLKE